MDSDPETDFSHTWISLKSLQDAAGIQQFCRVSNDIYGSPSLSPERGVCGKIGETRSFAMVHSRYTEGGRGGRGGTRERGESRERGERRERSAGGGQDSDIGMKPMIARLRLEAATRQEIHRNELRTLREYFTRKEKRGEESLRAKLCVLEQRLTEQRQYIALLERYISKDASTPPPPSVVFSSISTRPPLSHNDSPLQSASVLPLLQDLSRGLESLQTALLQTRGLTPMLEAVSKLREITAGLISKLE